MMQAMEWLPPSYKDIGNKEKFKSQILQDIDTSIEFSNLKYLKTNKFKIKILEIPLVF